MSKYKKLAIFTHISAVMILIALMVVGSFYDLQISHKLSNGKSFFGAFFSIVGEWPAYGGLVIACLILYRLPVSLEKRNLIPYRIAIAVGMFGAFAVWGIKGTSIVEIPHKLYFALVLALFFTGVCLYFSKFIQEKTAVKYAKWATFAIMVILLSVIIINVMKIAWGRMRYREMLKVGSFDGFTQWWNPQGGGKGEFKSFPSGHSASACNILVFASLYDIIPRLKKFRVFAYGLSIVFIATVMVSRIVYNAHFLTDVLVGAFISYVCYAVLKYAYLNKGKQNFCENKLKSEPPIYEEIESF